MSWAIGYDSTWKRDIGYGVPAYCDHPMCDVEINRGLAHVCGEHPYGGDNGCGLYFCDSHLFYGDAGVQQCSQCLHGSEHLHDPSPDHPEWIAWKLTDESWQQWRDENPEQVAALRAASQDQEGGNG